MWYYELNQKAFGPVSNETIAEELKAGRITRMTLIWRQGWPQWKHLGETELAGTTPPPVAAVNIPPAYVAVQKKRKIDSRSLTSLFWWWFGLNLFCFPFYTLILFAYKDFPAPNLPIIGLMALCWVPLVAGAVLQYILVYKLWQVVQDGFARTSPGQAVGFMFIPYFNYYWFLPAYYGLAKDLNSYIDRHFGYLPTGQLRKAHPKLVLSYVISLWASVVISMGLGMFMYFKMIISVMNGGFAGTSFIGYMIPAVVLSVLLIIFEIVVYLDVFQSARSILKAEENNQ